MASSPAIGRNVHFLLDQCRLTLLQTMISALCHALLLVRGCVETHPGPDPTPCPSEQDILAELAAGAPNNEVRDVLRDYKIGKDLTTQKKALKKHSKPRLVATMAYLGVPNQDDYYPETIVHNLIVRIHNFFPEECRECNEK